MDARDKELIRLQAKVDKLTKDVHTLAYCLLVNSGLSEKRFNQIFEEPEVDYDQGLLHDGEYIPLG